METITKEPDNENKPTGTGRKKGKTVAEVCQEIKKLVYYNVLAPGQKVFYQDLAKRLNVSVTPVVQALKVLEHSNLVRYESNKGYFVGEITETEAKELYQAREALETYAIPLIIENLTKEKLESMRRAFTEHSPAVTPESRGMLLLKDVQFHLRLVEYSGNQVIYNLLNDVFEQIYLRYRPEYLGKGRIRESDLEHRAILKSLDRGDAAEAIRLVKDHIWKGMDGIIRNIPNERNMVFYQIRELHQR